MKTFECPVCKKNTMLYERSGIYARKTHCGYCKTELNFRDIEYCRIKSILFARPREAELENENAELKERIDGIIKEYEMCKRTWTMRLDEVGRSDPYLASDIKNYILVYSNAIKILQDKEEK